MISFLRRTLILGVLLPGYLYAQNAHSDNLLNDQQKNILKAYYAAANAVIQHAEGGGPYVLYEEETLLTLPLSQQQILRDAQDSNVLNECLDALDRDHPGQLNPQQIDEPRVQPHKEDALRLLGSEPLEQEAVNQLYGHDLQIDMIRKGIGNVYTKEQIEAVENVLINTHGITASFEHNKSHIFKELAARFPNRVPLYGEAYAEEIYLQYSDKNTLIGDFENRIREEAVPFQEVVRNHIVSLLLTQLPQGPTPPKILDFLNDQVTYPFTMGESRALNAKIDAIKAAILARHGYSPTHNPDESINYGLIYAHRFNLLIVDISESDLWNDLFILSEMPNVRDRGLLAILDLIQFMYQNSEDNQDLKKLYRDAFQFFEYYRNLQKNLEKPWLIFDDAFWKTRVVVK